MTVDPASWLAEAVITRDLGRIRGDMIAAGNRINDARATVKAARKVQADAPSFAIAGCHDAARKSITAHMVATGCRPKKGDGAHRVVIEYARHVLGHVITVDTRASNAASWPSNSSKRTTSPHT